MLPLNDTEKSRYGASYMTMLIIVISTVVLIFEMLLASYSYGFLGLLFYFFGSNSALIMAREGLGGWSVISTVFLHGDFFHLLSNMWALWVFGRRVEDACGSWRFLAFYLFCGAAAEIPTTIIHMNSDRPGIGASGAVFGVMGAYLLLYPEGRIRTLILPYPLWPKIRAFWVVIYFFITQIPPALAVAQNNASYQIGYWAHIGGFFGAVMIIFFLRPDAFQRYINHLPM